MMKFVPGGATKAMQPSEYKTSVCLQEALARKAAKIAKYKMDNVIFQKTNPTSHSQKKDKIMKWCTSRVNLTESFRRGQVGQAGLVVPGMQETQRYFSTFRYGVQRIEAMYSAGGKWEELKNHAAGGQLFIMRKVEMCSMWTSSCFPDSMAGKTQTEFSDYGVCGTHRNVFFCRETVMSCKESVLRQLCDSNWSPQKPGNDDDCIENLKHDNWKDDNQEEALGDSQQDKFRNLLKLSKKQKDKDKLKVQAASEDWSIALAAWKSQAEAMCSSSTAVPAGYRTKTTKPWGACDAPYTYQRQLPFS